MALSWVSRLKSWKLSGCSSIKLLNSSYPLGFVSGLTTIFFNSVNLSMSTYLNDSLINKVNYSDINEWVEVSQDFIEVLRYAVDTCIKSKGLYDVSIGKLVDSWGFGSLEKNQKPSLKDIQYLKTQVGCDSIEINDEASAVKRKRDVALDFSSIAKGFAIDKVYKHLYSELNIENIFIELTISYPDAVFGSKVEIPTLDGKSTLKIPSGIQSGKLLRMRGKGFPMLRSSSKGDQIVRVVVDTPASLSRQSKKIIESLKSELSPIKNPFSKIDL